MASPSDTKLKRQAQARVKLHAAMERALAARMRRKLDEAAHAAAEAARQRKRHDEIAAAALAVLLSASTVALLRAHVISVAQAFTALTLEEIQITDEAVIAAANDDVNRWVDPYVRRQASEIAEATHRAVLRTINAAEAEASAAQIVDADVVAEAVAAGIVTSLVGKASQSRALTIATVITQAAAGEASEGSALVASARAQITIGRQWFSLKDGKTRLTHLIANGQRVGLAQSFLVGGVYLRFPGDPTGPARETINCRCAAVYIRLAASAQQSQRLAA